MVSCDVPAIRIRTKVTSTALTLPELAPLIGREVEVTIRDQGAVEWPDGWFEVTGGAIVDPDFVRPSQPALKNRRAIEP
jgi:hypothetical protein